MSDLPAIDREGFERLALDLAQAAAGAILPHFRSGTAMQNKARPGAMFDPVTVADRAAEVAMRRLLGQRAPQHGVLGEEYGQDRADAEFVWVLDPIDGTRAFVAGLTSWTTLIALRHRGRPMLGVIAQPFLDEIYIGDGHVARLLTKGGEKRLRTRACSTLTDAVLATTDPYLFDSRESVGWTKLCAAAPIARYGCDAYAFARLAAGDIDLVVEAGLKPWDIEAAIPLIEGAGGVCADWRGGPIGPDGGRIVASGDRSCLTHALETLSRI